MTEQRVTLTRADVEKLLPKLHEHISRADSDRLDSIVPLFSGAGQTKANLAECLDAVSPQKKGDRQKQQADFRQFRQHVRKAFAEVGLGIELTVDTRKRDDAADRECWFTSPPVNRTAERIERFSHSAAGDGQPDAVEPLGVDSNLIGQPVARCCVLAASTNQDLAEKLVELLRSECRAQTDFVYDIWSRESVLPGENSIADRRQALHDADVVLQLASPEFLADEELRFSKDDTWAESIPVLLKRLSPNHDQSCLGGCELFQVRLPLAGEKSFQECNGKQRSQFAQELFEVIHQRMRQRPSAPGPIARQTFPPFDDEAALGLTELFTDNEPADRTVEPRGTQARFGEDVTKRGTDADAAGAVPMFTALDDWIRDPQAAVYAAILGESGIGKTTLLKTLTVQWIDARGQDPSLPLPIYIDLRLFMPTIQEQKKVPTNLVELLDEVLGRAAHRGDVSGICGEDIVRMVQQEGAILILDGLDEKLVHLDENQGMALMRVLWEALPFSEVRRQRREQEVRHGRLVFSCRSHYFKSLRDQNSLFLGEDREGLKSDDYCAWVLLPFNEEQVREYLGRTIGSERVEPAIELFRSVHNLEELSGRPLLLSLMVPQIDALEQMRARGEPVYGVTLYDMLVARWLTRDGGKHHIRPEDKVTLMQNMAADMWADGRREWDWSEVRDWLARQLVRTDVLRARYGNIDFEILEEDFRTATFVLRPSQSMSNFRFAHTSLHEYFLACYLKTCLLSSDPAATVAGWNLPLPSRETLEFLGQLIAGKRHDEHRYDRCLTALNGLLGSNQPGEPTGVSPRVSSGTQLPETRGLTPAGSPENAAARLQAAVVAFRYWLLAIETDLPEPQPRQVNLTGANLYGLHIRGRSPNRRLNLVRANLAGCNLRGVVRFEHVDLTSADLTGVRGESIEFLDVRAPQINITDADLTGMTWRRGDVTGLTGASTASLRGSRWVDCRLDAALLADVAAVGGTSSQSQRPQDSRPCPDAATIRTHEGHSDPVTACGFSTDGTRIVSASHDNTVKLWDANTGECIRTCEGHSNEVTACGFSTDGTRIVSAARDHTVKLWDANTDECIRTCEGHSGAVTACGFSTDGTRIVSASHDNTVKLWDANTGECIRTCEGHSSAVNACGFSTDGTRIVSAARDHTVKLWDANTGECIRTCEGHSDTVTACGFSTDGTRIVSAAWDHTVKLWDANTGECIRTCEGHSSAVNACGFSTDGTRIVSAARDHTVKLWDANTGECIRTCEGHSDTVTACGFSTDGTRIVSAAWDHTVKLWDANTGECIRTCEGHSSAVNACGFSTDGTRIVSAARDHTVKLWDANTGECIRTCEGHSDTVTACGFSTDGTRIVSAARDHTVKLWDANTGECIRTCEGHSDTVTACGFSTDGTRIVSAAWDHTVKLWDANTGECIRTHEGHSDPVTACSFSTDGTRIVSAARDHTVKLWDANTDECIRTCEGHSDTVTACGFSTDGTRIVSAAWDHTVKLWDANTGECIRTCEGHSDTVTACGFSTDGTRIVSAAWDHTVKLWDANTGECIRTCEGHSDTVTACGFSTDGTRIVSAAWDHTVKLWDANTGECPMTLIHGPAAQQAALDLPGNRILWASDDAWRLLRWHYTDPQTGQPQVLPAEHFGPLPTTPILAADSSRL